MKINNSDLVIYQFDVHRLCRYFVVLAQIFHYVKSKTSFWIFLEEFFRYVALLEVIVVHE